MEIDIRPRIYGYLVKCTIFCFLSLLIELDYSRLALFLKCFYFKIYIEIIHGNISLLFCAIDVNFTTKSITVLEKSIQPRDAVTDYRYRFDKCIQKITSRATP